MSEKPVIGVTSRCQTDPGKPLPETEQHYHDAVSKAGGIPRLIPFNSLNWEAEMDQVAGLLIIGGVDVEPRRYGDAKHPKTEFNVSQDDYDFALINMAINRSLPIMGVCRGHQLLGVQFGLRLHQHLPDVFPSEAHRGATHKVRIEKDSLIAQLLGCTETMVNSTHHQAVNFESARNKSNLKIAAQSPAGVVEAMEDGDKILSVQWHPERMIAVDNRLDMLPLFRWLVDKARS